MVAFALSPHVESKATMMRGDARMADLSGAHRDEPSTCRALPAQRRPRGAARTGGHGAQTSANGLTIVVAIAVWKGDPTLIQAVFRLIV